jgi:hypothetical protein
MTHQEVMQTKQEHYAGRTRTSSVAYNNRRFGDADRSQICNECVRSFCKIL